MTKRIKIALIANTSNFFNVFMINHIDHLSKKYDLVICCENVNFLRKKIPTSVKLVNINFKRGLNLYKDIISFFYTVSFFLKNRPHLSISFTPKIGFMVALASLISGTPKRFHWYTGQIWSNSKGFTKFFYKLIDRLIFLLSTYVLVDGISQRNFLIKEKIISKKNSAVLNKGSLGGVNLSKFKFKKKERIKLRKKYSIAKDTFVFLYLGRINKEKGISDLINAYNQIKNSHNTVLIFVGWIEDKNLINLFKENKKIMYFDFTNNPEDWFSFSDILCLPSYREGFGTVVIEAAACGIPTLCSNIYGLKDSIINNKTGIYHEVGNIDDIKKKMLYVLKNKLLFKKYGLLGKKRVSKDFEQNIITKKLLKLISLQIN